MRFDSVKWPVLAVIILIILGMSRCQDNHSETEEMAYLNHADTVAYVGVNTCRQCHADIYESFSHTGMGSSFHAALAEYSAGDFNGKVLRDSVLDLNYLPYWKGDSLYLREFRLNGTDTVYDQIRRIDFIVGSGQHTNSHMIYEHGYLFQAPFTWYAQEGRLDLPPGFENGANSRFSRKIGLECTSCHNAMPTGFVAGSVNKYREVPGAINCERCHGPGELHVKRIQSGVVVDTAISADPSIVNVGKLSPDLQFEVCQRCHLQGNPVLQPGKSFFDFKPGMYLREVMDVYLPRYSNDEDNFIMASHADRFKQSRCLIGNTEFNCTSCHNPHKSVKETRIENFNKVCASCHTSKPRHDCTLPEDQLKLANYNCVSCHMPGSGSADIPHVSIHDHRIQIPGEKSTPSGETRFLGLAAVNNEHPSNRSKALAYLQQFERFSPRQVYLDSAAYFLTKLKEGEDLLRLKVYYFFLAEDYAAIVKLVNESGANKVLEELDSVSFDNAEGWTAYRIGEAMRFAGDINAARMYLKKATALMPYTPDVMNKYAGILLAAGNTAAAEDAYEAVLGEYPSHREALNNRGYLYLLKGEFSKAKAYFRRAVQEDPDYELAWLNLASAAVQEDELDEALNALSQALRINPENERAAMMYLDINSKL